MARPLACLRYENNPNNSSSINLFLVFHEASAESENLRKWVMRKCNNEKAKQHRRKRWKKYPKEQTKQHVNVSNVDSISAVD